VSAARAPFTPGLSGLGDPALPPDFVHFPWVNPTAPQGGEVRLSVIGTFDSFNPFILRGQPAFAAYRLFDSLLYRNDDEPDAAYGRLAAEVAIAPDRSAVTFALHAAARFSDGVPITAADVAWSFDVLREHGRPQYAQLTTGVAAVQVEAPRRLTFRLRPDADRELPLIIGSLPVLPRHFWQDRPFDRPLTEPPPASGPYRLGAFAFGRSFSLERVERWWARDLPTTRGLYNFGRITYEYFRDSGVAMQAFKAGQIDWRSENIAREWATGYDFPAVRKGWVIRRAFHHRLPAGMQGFVMNTRRALFADRRVREAIALAFDFEWMNRTLFYGIYRRTESYFANSDLACSGIPEGAELALLAPWRAQLPPRLFTTPFVLPRTDGSGYNRAGLTRAMALLEAAGWRVVNFRLQNAEGRPFAFEILLNEPTFERVALPYRLWLRRLGIDASVRTVDAAEYQRRSDNFEFDMIMTVISQSDRPGPEQYGYWSCAAAHTPGSDNLAGVCNPVVEALLPAVVNAPDRASLLAAAHALDRVLLWNWYVVPNWHSDEVRVAYWNRFGYPDVPVRPGLIFDSWWIDPARDAALAAARGKH
jgi:microcin C transport system substrate-binding protein